MNKLIRKALLGDKQAQEECTRKGIVLPCPFCGKKEVLTLHSNGKIYHNYTIECAFNGRFVKLKDWNARPAPPIGRCGECKHFNNEGKYPVCWHTGLKIRSGDYFCSYFESKESKENGL